MFSSGIVESDELESHSTGFSATKITEARVVRIPLREEQARLTHARIATAAAALFVERGYAPTKIVDVARAAGVSAQTVYNTFGTKPALLKAAYDLTLAGDPDPVPMSERPAVVAVEQLTDPAAMVHGYVSLARQALDRLGPLMLQVVAGAAAGDADLQAHQQITDRERLTGTGQLAQRLDDLGGLAAEVTVERARDAIWAMFSVQVWQLLTGVLKWTGEDYEQWIGHTLCASLLTTPDGAQ